MGIATVAVYSDADRDALHVETLADEAVHIGPATVRRELPRHRPDHRRLPPTGAEAVHPGYGFLSENASFAKRLDDAGIAFIGPPTVVPSRPWATRSPSKKIADEAGVNTVPGHTEAIEDADQAVRDRAEIGYPVMLKASAGGGGKGMRIAFDDDECRDGFRTRAKRGPLEFRRRSRVHRKVHRGAAAHRDPGAGG